MTGHSAPGSCGRVIFEITGRGCLETLISTQWRCCHHCYTLLNKFTDKKLREIIELHKFLVIVIIVNVFAVCGYGYSRLNFHSQTVSRLDLPTLDSKERIKIQ